MKKGTLLHGTFKNIEGLKYILKDGLISSWFIEGRLSKYPSSVGVWNLKQDYLLKDYINFYSGGTIEYKNIDALHNFYPRAGTGISIEYMEKQNKLLSKRGIKVSSFIQSNNRKRGPIKEGLPTLENHRNLDVRIAANELFALGNETVFIGDSLPSIQELKELSLLKQDEIMLDIEVMVKDDIINRLLKETYTPRVDQARDAIRAVESRYNLNGDIIIPMNTIDSEIGYITIDNIEYGRYMGELQILKVNKKRDYRINVVAKVSENSLHLLRYIDEGKKFSFYNKEF